MDPFLIGLGGFILGRWSKSCDCENDFMIEKTPDNKFTVKYKMKSGEIVRSKHVFNSHEEAIVFVTGKSSYERFSTVMNVKTSVW